MSKAEAMRFWHDMGNNATIARELVRIKAELEGEHGTEGDYPIPVVAAYTVGDVFDYEFSKDDFMASLPDVKALYDAAGAASRAEAESAVAPTEFGSYSDQAGQALGWEDGDAGAMLGGAIGSYWDANADNWGVSSPKDWIHTNW